MSTRMTEAQALAARCRRVGWEVKMATGGFYRVKCPDGYIVQIHLTPSDRNSHKNVLGQLNDHGLAEAEKELEERKAKEKADKLAKQRADADAKTQKLAKLSAATAKAAGPYAGPELLPADWFLTPHPAPIMKWAIITPELAEMLLSRNVDNRPLKPKTIAHYVRVLKAGKWHLTHQGMAMDSRVILQDGQHRLTSIVEANVPAPVAFFCGMPPENFKAIDEGALRSVADLLGKDGETNRLNLQSTIKLVLAFKDPNPRVAHHLKTTNEELYDGFWNNSDEMREAVRWSGNNKMRGKFTVSAMAAARFLLREANGVDNPYVEAFFSGYLSGTKGDSRMVLEEDDPRLRLKAWITNKRDTRQKVESLDQVALIITVWNYVVQDHRPRNLRWHSGQSIPLIKVCRPDGDDPKPVPPCLDGEV